MKTKLLIIVSLFTFTISTNATIPIHDTITLKTNYVVGRWTEKKEFDNKSVIYIFREDMSFHKAIDNQDILFFNVAGKYHLSNDSIIILYQDFSKSANRKAKVRKMYLQVVAVSDADLYINKIENNTTQFIRLRRQKNE